MSNEDRGRAATISKRHAAAHMKNCGKTNHDERKSYKITCKQSYHAQYFYHKEVRGGDGIERAAVLKYVTRPFMAVLLMKVIVVVLFSGLENDGW